MKPDSEIKNNINQILYERLYPAIKKMFVDYNISNYMKSSEYRGSLDEKRASLLKHRKDQLYKNIETFYLSYYSIQALIPSVIIEKKILNFISEKKIRIRADYHHKSGINFSAYYPIVFDPDMDKEIDDIIDILKSPEHAHYVTNFKEKKDSNKRPPEPLTNAGLKYSAFYLLNFHPEHVTKLANNLFQAGLITNPSTNGWYIDDDTVREMVTVLYKKFPHDSILQDKREYLDRKIDRSADAIRPIYFTEKYFPRALHLTDEFKSIEFEDQGEALECQRLYEFIYYSTLSTQMKDAIYNTSSVRIIVSNIELKQSANFAIKGGENYELLLGPIINRIQANADENSRTVILPDLKMDERLICVNADRQPYDTVRPHRIGIGRFVTQVLEKKGIGENDEHDSIIEELIVAKAINVVGNMIIPNDIAIYMYNWLEAFCPRFINETFIQDTEAQIEDAIEEPIKEPGIYDQINRIVESAFKEAGYQENLSAPSQAKVDFAKAIARKHNLTLDAYTLSSNSRLALIIAKYGVVEEIKIGNCPSCNSTVLQKEFTKEDGTCTYSFKCEKYDKNGGCSFVIYDNYITNFFQPRGVNLYKIENRADTLTKILKKKTGYLFGGLLNKDNTTYDAFVSVALQSYKDKETHNIITKWGFEQVYKNSRARQQSEMSKSNNPLMKNKTNPITQNAQQQRHGGLYSDAFENGVKEDVVEHGHNPEVINNNRKMKDSDFEKGQIVENLDIRYHNVHDQIDDYAEYRDSDQSLTYAEWREQKIANQSGITIENNVKPIPKFEQPQQNDESNVPLRNITPIEKIDFSQSDDTVVKPISKYAQSYDDRERYIKPNNHQEPKKDSASQLNSNLKPIPKFENYQQSDEDKLW